MEAIITPEEQIGQLTSQVENLRRALSTAEHTNQGLRGEIEPLQAALKAEREAHAILKAEHAAAAKRLEQFESELRQARAFAEDLKGQLTASNGTAPPQPT